MVCFFLGSFLLIGLKMFFFFLVFDGVGFLFVIDGVGLCLGVVSIFDLWVFFFDFGGVYLGVGVGVGNGVFLEEGVCEGCFFFKIGC